MQLGTAITEHAWGARAQHHPTWDDTILECTKKKNSLRIKEAFCNMMVEQQHILNRD